MTSFTSFDGTQIKYRTTKDERYIDLDDPEVLKKSLSKPGTAQRNRKEAQVLKDRYRKRLAELGYERIPDEEPELSIFRAKHKLQCFEGRLDHTKKAMKDPKYLSISQSGRLRRKRFRDILLPRIQTILSDTEHTHSQLADSPKRRKLEELSKQLKKLQGIYAEMSQRRDEDDGPHSSKHEPGRTKNSSDVPEPNQFEDNEPFEDSEFSRFVHKIYKDLEPAEYDFES